MRSLFTSIAVLGLVAPGWAKPPTFPGYERAAGIQGRLRDAQRRLKAEEEFRKFPRMKKILISMKQGDLVIAADGRIAYLGEIVERAALEGLVRADAAGKPEFALTVLADREAEAIEVLAIMTRLHEAGVARIALMADRRR